MTARIRFAGLLLVVAACGTSSGGDAAVSISTKTASGTAVLTANNNTFAAATARVNDKVQLVSGDPVGHSVMSDSDAWTFDSKSSSFVAPAKAGAYPFYCGVHGKSMAGVLQVTA